MVRKTYQLLNMIGFMAVLTVNYLAVALPINGKTPGEISDRYPTLFTPAGFTFSIWSVIYLLLLIFIIKQSRNLFKSGQAAPGFVQTIGPWFFLNCIANAVWLIAWHHLQFGLSLAIMLGILATLLQIYLRLDIGQSKPAKGEWLGVHLPFSVYLGWITVATIANVSILLTSYQWGGLGIAPGIWAVIMVTVGTLIGLVMLFSRRDAAYSLVLVWAFFGIWSARKNEMPVASEVVTVTLVSIIALLLAIGFVFYRRLRT
jgi:hypothetical protein